MQNTLYLLLAFLVGDSYLFIESGGFSPKHPAGWTSPLMVLKRN